MDLEGGAVVRLNADGSRGQVVRAKGRLFTFGSFVNSDILITDNPNVKGVHCKIECDGFSRITVTSNSQTYPILLNGVRMPGTRPLRHGQHLRIFDSEFLWEFNRIMASVDGGAQSRTPSQTQAQTAAERLGSWSEPTAKYKSNVSRATVHDIYKFDHGIKSDDETSFLDYAGDLDFKVNDSLQTHRAEDTASVEATKVCVTPTRGSDLASESSNVTIVDSTRNKVNAKTAEGVKELSLCTRSPVVVTSFTPRQTGICQGKTFVAIKNEGVDLANAHKKTPLFAGERVAISNKGIHVIDLTSPVSLWRSKPCPRNISKLAATPSDSMLSNTDDDSTSIIEVSLDSPSISSHRTPMKSATLFKQALLSSAKKDAQSKSMFSTPKTSRAIVTSSTPIASTSSKGKTAEIALSAAESVVVQVADTSTIAAPKAVQEVSSASALPVAFQQEQDSLNGTFSIDVEEAVAEIAPAVDESMEDSVVTSTKALEESNTIVFSVELPQALHRGVSLSVSVVDNLTEQRAHDSNATIDTTPELLAKLNSDHIKLSTSYGEHSLSQSSQRISVTPPRTSKSLTTEPQTSELEVPFETTKPFTDWGRVPFAPRTSPNASLAENSDLLEPSPSNAGLSLEEEGEVSHQFCAAQPSPDTSPESVPNDAEMEILKKEGDSIRLPPRSSPDISLRVLTEHKDFASSNIADYSLSSPEVSEPEYYKPLLSARSSLKSSSSESSSKSETDNFMGCKETHRRASISEIPTHQHVPLQIPNSPPFLTVNQTTNPEPQTNVLEVPKNQQPFETTKPFTDWGRVPFGPRTSPSASLADNADLLHRSPLLSNVELSPQREESSNPFFAVQPSPNTSPETVPSDTEFDIVKKEKSDNTIPLPPRSSPTSSLLALADDMSFTSPNFAGDCSPSTEESQPVYKPLLSPRHSVQSSEPETDDTDKENSSPPQAALVIEEVNNALAQQLDETNFGKEIEVAGVATTIVGHATARRRRSLRLSTSSNQSLQATSKSDFPEDILDVPELMDKQIVNTPRRSKRRSVSQSHADDVESTPKIMLTPGTSRAQKRGRRSTTELDEQPARKVPAVDASLLNMDIIVEEPESEIVNITESGDIPNESTCEELSNQSVLGKSTSLKGLRQRDMSCVPENYTPDEERTPSPKTPTQQDDETYGNEVQAYVMCDERMPSDHELVAGAAENGKNETSIGGSSPKYHSRPFSSINQVEPESIYELYPETATTTGTDEVLCSDNGTFATTESVLLPSEESSSPLLKPEGDADELQTFVETAKSPIMSELQPGICDASNDLEKTALSLPFGDLEKKLTELNETVPITPEKKADNLPKEQLSDDENWIQNLGVTSTAVKLHVEGSTREESLSDSEINSPAPSDISGIHRLNDIEDSEMIDETIEDTIALTAQLDSTQHSEDDDVITLVESSASNSTSAYNEPAPSLSIDRSTEKSTAESLKPPLSTTTQSVLAVSSTYTSASQSETDASNMSDTTANIVLSVSPDTTRAEDATETVAEVTEQQANDAQLAEKNTIDTAIVAQQDTSVLQPPIESEICHQGECDLERMMEDEEAEISLSEELLFDSEGGKNSVNDSIEIELTKAEEELLLQSDGENDVVIDSDTEVLEEDKETESAEPSAAVEKPAGMGLLPMAEQSELVHDLQQPSVNEYMEEAQQDAIDVEKTVVGRETFVPCNPDESEKIASLAAEESKSIELDISNTIVADEETKSAKLVESETADLAQGVNGTLRRTDVVQQTSSDGSSQNEKRILPQTVSEQIADSLENVSNEEKSDVSQQQQAIEESLQIEEPSAVDKDLLNTELEEVIESTYDNLQSKEFAAAGTGETVLQVAEEKALIEPSLDTECTEPEVYDIESAKISVATDDSTHKEQAEGEPLTINQHFFVTVAEKKTQEDTLVSAENLLSVETDKENAADEEADITRPEESLVAAVVDSVNMETDRTQLVEEGDRVELGQISAGGESLINVVTNAEQPDDKTTKTSQDISSTAAEKLPPVEATVQIDDTPASAENTLSVETEKEHTDNYLPADETTDANMAQSDKALLSAIHPPDEVEEAELESAELTKTPTVPEDSTNIETSVDQPEDQTSNTSQYLISAATDQMTPVEFNLQVEESAENVLSVETSKEQAEDDLPVDETTEPKIVQPEEKLESAIDEPSVEEERKQIEAVNAELERNQEEPTAPEDSTNIEISVEQPEDETSNASQNLTSAATDQMTPVEFNLQVEESAENILSVETSKEQTDDDLPADETTESKIVQSEEELESDIDGPSLEEERIQIEAVDAELKRNQEEPTAPEDSTNIEISIEQPEDETSNASQDCTSVVTEKMASAELNLQIEDISPSSENVLSVETSKERTEDDLAADEITEPKIVQPEEELETAIHEPSLEAERIQIEAINAELERDQDIPNASVDSTNVETNVEQPEDEPTMVIERLALVESALQKESTTALTVNISTIETDKEQPEGNLPSDGITEAKIVQPEEILESAIDEPSLEAERVQLQTHNLELADTPTVSEDMTNIETDESIQQEKTANHPSEPSEQELEASTPRRRVGRNVPRKNYDETSDGETKKNLVGSGRSKRTHKPTPKMLELRVQASSAHSTPRSRQRKAATGKHASAVKDEEPVALPHFSHTETDTSSAADQTMGAAISAEPEAQKKRGRPVRRVTKDVRDESTTAATSAEEAPPSKMTRRSNTVDKENASAVSLAEQSTEPPASTRSARTRRAAAEKPPIKEEDSNDSVEPTVHAVKRAPRGRKRAVPPAVGVIPEDASAEESVAPAKSKRARNVRAKPATTDTPNEAEKKTHDGEVTEKPNKGRRARAQPPELHEEKVDTAEQTAPEPKQDAEPEKPTRKRRGKAAAPPKPETVPEENPIPVENTQAKRGRKRTNDSTIEIAQPAKTKRGRKASTATESNTAAAASSAGDNDSNSSSEPKSAAGGRSLRCRKTPVRNRDKTESDTDDDVKVGKPKRARAQPNKKAKEAEEGDVTVAAEPAVFSKKVINEVITKGGRRLRKPTVDEHQDQEQEEAPKQVKAAKATKPTRTRRAVRGQSRAADVTVDAGSSTETDAAVPNTTATTEAAPVEQSASLPAATATRRGARAKKVHFAASEGSTLAEAEAEAETDAPKTRTRRNRGAL